MMFVLHFSYISLLFREHRLLIYPTSFSSSLLWLFIFVSLCTIIILQISLPGTFRKGMKVGHSRMKRTINLSSAQALFAQDRESITEAFPGDVIGTYVTLIGSTSIILFYPLLDWHICFYIAYTAMRLISFTLSLIYNLCQCHCYQYGNLYVRQYTDLYHIWELSFYLIRRSLYSKSHINTHSHIHIQKWIQAWTETPTKFNL